jgi:tetratricopeptide (TPR) repeat protein
MLTVALVHNFLGQIRLSRGDLDSATQHFREGLSAGRRASDRVSILISFYDLAMSSQAGGELTEAAGFLREGLSVAAEAGDETSVAYYLEGLAAVAGQQDNSQRAVRLLSAAAAMLQANGSGWLHAYVPRAAHDDGVLAVLRSRLGDTAFAQAWAWGGSAGGRNAVDYALETG